MATRDRRRCYSPRTRSPVLPPPPPPPIIPPEAVRLFPDRSRPADSSRRMEEQSEKSDHRGDERDFCIQKLAEFNQSLRRAESASTKFRWEHLLADKSCRAATAAAPVHSDKENVRISISKIPSECGTGNENRFTDRKLPLGFYPLPSDNDSGMRKIADDFGRSCFPDGSIGNYGGSSSLRVPAFVGDSRSNPAFGAPNGRLSGSSEVAGPYGFGGNSVSNPFPMPEHGCCGPNPTEEFSKSVCGDGTKSRAINGILNPNAETCARNGCSPRDELRERALNHQYDCCSLPPRLHNLVGGSCLKEQDEDFRGSNTACLSNRQESFLNNGGRTDGDITKSGGIGGIVYSNAETVAVNRSSPRDDRRENRALNHQYQHCYLPPSSCNSVGGSRLKEQDEEFRDSSSAYLRTQRKAFFNYEGLPSRKGEISEMGHRDAAKCGGIDGIAYSNAETYGVKGRSPRDDLGENGALNHQHLRCTLPPNYHDLVGGSHLKEQGKEFRGSNSAYRRSQQETFISNEGLPSRKDEINEMGYRDVTESGCIDGIVYSNAETYGVNGRSPRVDLGEKGALNHQHPRCSLPPNYHDSVGGSHLKEQGKDFWDSNSAYLRNQQETFFNNEGLPSRKDEINEMGFGDVTRNGGINGIAYSNAETYGVNGRSPRDDLWENRAMNHQQHCRSLPLNCHDLVGGSHLKEQGEFWDSNTAYHRSQQEFYFNNEGLPSRKGEINEMGYEDVTESGGIDGIAYSNEETFGVNGSFQRDDLGENGALNYQHHRRLLPPSYDDLIGGSPLKEQDEEFLDSNTAYLRNQHETLFHNEGLPYRKDEGSLDYGMSHLQNPSLVFGERQLPKQEMEEVLDSNLNHLQNQDGAVFNREMPEFGKDCGLGSYRLSPHDTSSYVSQGSTRQVIAAEDQRNGKPSWKRRIIDLRKVKERPRKRSKAERNSKSPDDIDIMRSDDESNRQFVHSGISGLKRRQDANALQFDDLGSQRSVFAQGRLGEPVNSSSRKSVKERLGLPQYAANSKPLPWLDPDKKKKLQKKSSNDFGDRIQAQSGDLPKVEVKCANNESPEDSEEFKQQVHVAFLKFVKLLYENSSNRKKYTERGGTGIIKCCVCDSSKEFMDTRGLVTHAFSSGAAGLRGEHLGLHRALCLVMGWDSRATSKHSWFPKTLRYADILSVKEELIIWPPVVLIHNNSIANTNSGDRLVVSNEELGAIIQGMGFKQGLFKVCRGKPANQSIMVAMFPGTFSGLQEAERLHKLYAENKHGRAEFDQINPCNRKTQAEKVESVLYGYMGIADDLEKLDFETKRRCVVKSKKEIQALAVAQNLFQT